MRHGHRTRPIFLRAEAPGHMPLARKKESPLRPSARPLLPPSLGISCSVDGTVSASKKRRQLALRDGEKWASAGRGLVRYMQGAGVCLGAVLHSGCDVQKGQGGGWGKVAPAYGAPLLLRTRLQANVNSGLRAPGGGMSCGLGSRDAGGARRSSGAPL